MRTILALSLVLSIFPFPYHSTSALASPIERSSSVPSYHPLSEAEVQELVRQEDAYLNEAIRLQDELHPRGSTGEESYRRYKEAVKDLEARDPFFTRFKQLEPALFEALSKFSTRAEFTYWLTWRFGQPFKEALVKRQIPVQFPGFSRGGNPEGFFGSHLFFPLESKNGDSDGDQAFELWRAFKVQGFRNAYHDEGRVTQVEIDYVKATVPPLAPLEKAVLDLERELEMKYPSDLNPDDPKHTGLMRNQPGVIFRQFLWDAVREAQTNEGFFRWVREAYGEAAIELLKRRKHWPLAMPPYKSSKEGYVLLPHMEYDPLIVGETLDCLDPLTSFTSAPYYAALNKAGWGVLCFDPLTGQARVASRGSAKCIEKSFRSTPFWVGCDVKEVKEKPGGLIVTKILPKSPAEKADLKKDDRLLRLEGRTLSTRKEWEEAVNAYQEGSVLLIMGERAGALHTWKLRLECR